MPPEPTAGLAPLLTPHGRLRLVPADQRKRNINQLAPGTLQANPGIKVNALRPYQGFGVISLAEDSGYMGAGRNEVR